MKSILHFLFIFFLTSSSFGQAGNIDLTFNPDDPGYSNGLGCVGSVRAIAQLPSGKILVAGAFNYFEEINQQVIRLNPDGSMDNLFGTGAVVTGTINTILPQASGKILIGGATYYFDGDYTQRHIARLTPSGLLDMNLNTSFSQNYRVNALIEQSDSKVIAVGDFTSYTGASNDRIIRLNADGTYDDTFVVTTGFNSEVFDAKLQVDQKVICGGKFTTYNGTSISRIARINADGSIDNSFTTGTGFNGDVKTVLVQEDGKIIVGGLFTEYNGSLVNHIARLNTDGSLDDTFMIGEGFSDNVITTSIQSDQKIIVAGEFTMFNGMTCGKLTRLNPDGSLDETFLSGTGLTGSAVATLVLADGSIMVGGTLGFYNNFPVGTLMHILPDGQLDLMFQPYSGLNVLYESQTMELQSDGNMLVAGKFEEYNGEAKRNIFRLLADGNGLADPTFVAKSNDHILDVSLQPDQRILIAGNFTQVNDQDVPFMARLLPSGELDPTFQPGITESYVIAISIVAQPDDKILVAVGLADYTYRIFRLMSDGSLDNSFYSGLFSENYYCRIILQDDNKILVWGQNTGNFDGNPVGGLMRLNADGTMDSGFTPDNYSSLLDVKSIEDNKILLCRYGNGLTDHLIRLNSDGTVDPEFDMSGIDSYTGYPKIDKMAVQENGKIVIAGEFNIIGNVEKNGVARLCKNGSLDEGYDPLEGINGYDDVKAIALDQDEKLIIIGLFTDLCGVGRNHIARLLNGDLMMEPIADGEVCRGETIEVSYTTLDELGTGNVFTAELSDETGDFSNPTILSSEPGTTSGSMMVTIPLEVPGSDQYRIRIVASNPPYNTEYTNDAFSIFAFENNAYYQTLQHYLYTTVQDAEYQWVDCYNDYAPIEGATEVNYIPTTTSSYAVEVTVNGCTELSNCVVVLGMDENKNRIQPSIYPNPNDGTFSLNPGDNTFDSYRVINMIGECILECKSVIQTNKEISFRADAGQYLVLLYLNDEIVEKIPVMVK